ncbi:MAG TPA: DUF72 domain-containing protein [Dongiaceae bacterium]|nr:DUF72 domain-containing protein [Dongiaceae bacterium]
MQTALFPDADLDIVGAATPEPAVVELAASLPPSLRLGTSSWHYPGWTGLVWNRDYSAEALSRHGLAAYSQHPLLNAVGLDRSFYRPMTVAQFAAMAAQVPDNFRFVVKAPGLVTDALLRDEAGRGTKANEDFLNPERARLDFAESALAGLGAKLGVLVFQISPLPSSWLTRLPELTTRLHAMLQTIRNVCERAPGVIVAVEVRDAQWLTPFFTSILRETGATYCLGLHAKMPPIKEQLPILRALWPGPLVCRWNLNPLHGAFGYEDAQRLYSPYHRLVDPDLETRAALAKVIAGTVGAGQQAYVTLSNKAEGSAPLSVIALAQAVQGLCSVVQT